MFYYFELIKVTVANGPVGVLRSSLLELPKKLPIRNSWESIRKVTGTVTDFFFYFEII